MTDFKDISEVQSERPKPAAGIDQVEPNSPVDSFDIDTAIAEFSASITTAHGIDIDPEPDSEIHRFDDSEKKPGNNNCWYFLADDCTHGCHGNWGTGDKCHWRLDDFQVVSDEELAIIEARIEAAKNERVQKRVEGHAIAAEKAVGLIDRAEPADPNHPYLKRKHIGPANALQINETLLIPIRTIDGNLCNVQKTWPGGKKRFMKGGEISGKFSLIGGDDLPTSGRLYVCEGWATGVTLSEMHGCPVVVAMNAGNLPTVCKALREKLLNEVTIIVAADDDRRTKGNPGLAKAIEAGDAIGAEFIRPNFPCDNCECSDFNDVAACLRLKKSGRTMNSPLELKSMSSAVTSTAGHPIRLTSSLPPVPPFDPDMLPDSIVGFVTDSAKRMQTPPDFLATGGLAVCSATVGSKCGIHPKQNDNWLIIPTFWGAMVGGPSTLKSACMGATQQPLIELETELAAVYAEAREVHGLDAELSEEHLKAVKKEARDIYGKDREKAIKTIRDATFTGPPPTRQRYILNDATVEKLGELLGENPNGMILMRDELNGLLAKLGQEDHQSDRAFYLECYDGLYRFISDRIGRGTNEAKSCTLSIFGGIQPSKFAHTIRNAIQGTVDDGLIQRFQFAVWPDIPKKWKWVDQAPDAAAYSRYRDVIRTLHELPAPEPGEPGICLRFSEPAQALYIEWMEQLHVDIRSDSVHPVMQSHLAKMPKTIAGLALLFELIDGGRKKVGKKATARALKWAPYLTAHAQRLYSLSTSQDITGARLILSRREKLPDLFTVRDVRRKKWAGLTTTQAATEALECLLDHRFLSEIPVTASHIGGRPTTRYRWHPFTSDFS